MRVPCSTRPRSHNAVGDGPLIFVVAQECSSLLPALSPAALRTRLCTGAKAAASPDGNAVAEDGGFTRQTGGKLAGEAGLPILASARTVATALVISLGGRAPRTGSGVVGNRRRRHGEHGARGAGESPSCHAGGRGFESRRSRPKRPWKEGLFV